MSEVGDAIELTYATAPNSTVTVSWINRATGVAAFEDVPVDERLGDQGEPTGLFPITVVGDSPGLWEARFSAAGASTNVESFFERFVNASDPTPLATVSEYQDLYGALSSPRQATARALLLRASKLIRDAFPGVDAKIASGTVSADTLGLVVLNMVAQVMRNPGGLRSETTGPFSRSYDPEAASGLLRLSTADRELLADAGLDTTAGGRRGKIGTARAKANLAPPTSRPGRRWPRGGAFPSGW